MSTSRSGGALPGLRTVQDNPAQAVSVDGMETRLDAR